MKTVCVLQMFERPHRWARRQWVLAPDFPAYAGVDDACAALESWLDGEWKTAVHRSGGSSEVSSLHVYTDRAGRPVARVVELEVMSVARAAALGGVCVEATLLP